MLLTYLNCEDCQENLEFTDEINKNNTNFSKEECTNYEISFIKKNIENVFEYTIIFTCKKCKFKINKTFKEKEANFHFKCEKCPLKGMNFNYFLSKEDDVYQKNDSNIDSHPKENNVLQPLNSLNDLTPAIGGNKFTNSNAKSGINQMHSNLDLNPFKNEINNNNNFNNNINNNNPNNPNNNPNNINIINNDIINQEDNSKNVAPIKRYSTPKEEVKTVKEKEKEKEKKDEEIIKIIFIKNKQKYSLYFKRSDSINNKINYIKQNIDLGNNPVFIYNSNEIDKNKSFAENQIYGESYIEIEDE